MFLLKLTLLSSAQIFKPEHKSFIDTFLIGCNKHIVYKIALSPRHEKISITYLNFIQQHFHKSRFLFKICLVKSFRSADKNFRKYFINLIARYKCESCQNITDYYVLVNHFSYFVILQRQWQYFHVVAINVYNSLFILSDCIFMLLFFLFILQLIFLNNFYIYTLLSHKKARPTDWKTLICIEIV